MQVGRWGNSLAVRLPAAVVEALGLKEGDEIEIEVAEDGRFRVRRDRRREEALETLRSLGWHLPPGFRFDREDANDRDLARREAAEERAAEARHNPDRTPG